MLDMDIYKFSMLYALLCIAMRVDTCQGYTIGDMFLALGNELQNKYTIDLIKKYTEPNYQVTMISPKCVGTQPAYMDNGSLVIPQEYVLVGQLTGGFVCPGSIDPRPHITSPCYGTRQNLGGMYLVPLKPNWSDIVFENVNVYGIFISDGGYADQFIFFPFQQQFLDLGNTLWPMDPVFKVLSINGTMAMGIDREEMLDTVMNRSFGQLGLPNKVTGTLSSQPGYQYDLEYNIDTEAISTNEILSGCDFDAYKIMASMCTLAESAPLNFLSNLVGDIPIFQAFIPSCNTLRQVDLLSRLETVLRSPRLGWFSRWITI